MGVADTDGDALGAADVGPSSGAGTCVQPARTRAAVAASSPPPMTRRDRRGCTSKVYGRPPRLSPHVARTRRSERNVLLFALVRDRRTTTGRGNLGRPITDRVSTDTVSGAALSARGVPTRAV